MAASSGRLDELDERGLLSLEDMIEEAGGDGIFQTRVLLLVLLSLVFASLLLYALPFLLLFPQYT